MKWSDIQFQPTKRVLRQFAAAWLVIFLGLGAYHYLKLEQHTRGIVFAAVALLIGPLGLFKPAAVRWIFVSWMVLAFPAGWLISQLMLAVLFYLVLTPTAVLFRLRGRDLLVRKPMPDPVSFWVPKHTPEDVRSYFRQY